MLPKGFCQNSEMKNFGEYYDLHVQSDTLLLTDVSELLKFVYWNISTVCFFNAPILAWQAVTKNTR